MKKIALILLLVSIGFAQSEKVDCFEKLKELAGRSYTFNIGNKKMTATNPPEEYYLLCFYHISFYETGYMFTEYISYSYSKSRDTGTILNENENYYKDSEISCENGVFVIKTSEKNSYHTMNDLDPIKEWNYGDTLIFSIVDIGKINAKITKYRQVCHDDTRDFSKWHRFNRKK